MPAAARCDIRNERPQQKVFVLRWIGRHGGFSVLAAEDAVILQQAAFGQAVKQFIGKECGRLTVHSIVKADNLLIGLINDDVGNVFIPLFKQKSVIVKEFRLALHINRRHTECVCDLVYGLIAFSHGIGNILR